MSKKFKAHIVYKTADGKRVPGVTTITGILAKPALIHWAWDLGIQGKDYKKYKNNLADIGTLTHEMIVCFCKGETPDTSDYSNKQIEQAEKCFAKFKNWLNQNPVEFIFAEKPFVSEKYRYGGTLDSLARRKNNGNIILLDYKTSKAVYGEQFLQLSGYHNLVHENTDYRIDENIILRIGRDDIEGFEAIPRKDLKIEWEFFKHCKSVYDLRKKLKKAGRW